MPRDKQLCGIEFSGVLKKRQLDQALNAKEFAVMAGISYSMAREWFRLPGFPVIRGVVFWGDFVRWRRVQVGLINLKSKPCQTQADTNQKDRELKSMTDKSFPLRAIKILAEAG